MPKIQEGGHLQPCADVADAWECWNGESQWSKGLRELQALGCRMVWYCGYPQSLSAIPLCFAIYDASGKRLPIEQRSRLKDIRAAIRYMQSGGGV